MKRDVFVINSLDLKVIRRLMTEGRSTWAELGQLLGVSAPAAADRVRRLEEKNVIRGYNAVIDPEALDLGLAAFIAVCLERPEHRAGFLNFVMETPAIQECHHMAGAEDYLLKVRCSGTRDLERLISEDLKAVPGVIKTRTTIVLSTVKESLQLPIKEMEGHG